jgi:hypothetical protein
MVYVVERYLPGVSTEEIEQSLQRLTAVTRQMRDEGTAVRFQSSTIVPEDEACFCQFESPSEAAVAEANSRAGIAFDRIVPAIAVVDPIGPVHEENR